MDTINYLKRNVKQFRIDNHLSQQALAEKSDISISYLQDIELGRKQPSITTLDKIASALKIETFQLLQNPDRDKSTIIKDYSEKLKEIVITEIEKLANKY